MMVNRGDDFANTAAETVTEMVQSSWSIWSKMIYITGEFPAFAKYMYQVHSHLQGHRQGQACPNDEFKCNVMMEDHQGSTHDIKRVEAKHPLSGLGLPISPLGNQTPQFKSVLAKLKSCIAKATRGSRMGTSYAWLALTTHIIPMFAFLLALTFLDNSMLLIMGISRKMKNVVFYALFELKGIGYPQMGLLQDQTLK